jgi:DNA-binding Xre family transcriptional regulator
MIDFFLIGPPKTGTTSLYNWLNGHPKIIGSHPKEPFYFVDEDHPRFNPKSNYNHQGIDGIGEFFPEKNDESLLFFEATTHLYYQKTALQFCKDLSKKPKAIFIYRDPSDRVRSAFDFTKYNLGNIKEELSFNDYVDLLISRNSDRLKEYFYSDSSFWVLSRQIELSAYKKYLEQWRAIIGAENLIILQFESLKSIPLEVLDEICEKLNIENCFHEADLLRHNKSRIVTNSDLRRLAQDINDIIGKYLPCKDQIKKLYYDIQKSDRDSENYDKGLEKLREYFDQLDN